MDHPDLRTVIVDFFNRTEINDPFLDAVCAGLTDLGWHSTVLITDQGGGQRVTADLDHPGSTAIVMAVCSPETPTVIQILQPMDWWVTCTEGDADIVTRAINAATGLDDDQSIFEVLGAHGFTAEHTPGSTGGTFTWSHADGRRAVWHAAEPGQYTSGHWVFGNGEYQADGDTPTPIVTALLGLSDQP